MNLAQLLAINGELEFRGTDDAEATLFPGVIPEFSNSEWGILERWKFSWKKTAPGEQWPYSLMAIHDTRSSDRPRRSFPKVLLRLFSTSNSYKQSEPQRDADWPQQKKRLPDRIRRLAYWLLAALLALAAVACGFGLQEIRFSREKYRMGQQLRVAEQRRKTAELACRQMHACLVVYAARERQEQIQTRPALYIRPNTKPNSRS